MEAIAIAASEPIFTRYLLISYYFKCLMINKSKHYVPVIRHITLIENPAPISPEP